MEISRTGGMMASKSKPLLVLCECLSPEHQIIFRYFKDPSDSWPEMYMSVHLGYWEGFLHRLWVGLRYAFGYRSKYGHFDEVVMGVPTVRRLHKYIEEFLELPGCKE